MRKNTPLLPVEIIEQATAGEPEAVEAIIQHFSGYIKYLSYYCVTKTEKTSEQQIAFPPSCLLHPVWRQLPCFGSCDTVLSVATLW